MKNKIILLVLVCVLMPQIALAKFSVMFEDDPLFFEVNILPGDEYAEYIRVFNSDIKLREVYMKAENLSDTEELGTKLQFDTVVRGTNASVYSGPMSDFVSGDWIQLPYLNAREEEYYDLTVKFDSASGNEYQKTSLSFDVVMRSESDQGSCVCHYNCGYEWGWKKWYLWNNYFRHWFGKVGWRWWPR